MSSQDSSSESSSSRTDNDYEEIYSASSVNPAPGNASNIYQDPASERMIYDEAQDTSQTSTSDSDTQDDSDIVSIPPPPGACRCPIGQSRDFLLDGLAPCADFHLKILVLKLFNYISYLVI